MKLEKELELRTKVRNIIQNNNGRIFNKQGSAQRELFSLVGFNMNYHTFCALIDRMCEAGELKIERSVTKTYAITLVTLPEINVEDHIPPPKSELDLMADHLITRCAEILQQDSEALQQRIVELQQKVYLLTEDNLKKKRELEDLGDNLRILRDTNQGLRTRLRLLEDNANKLNDPRVQSNMKRQAELESLGRVMAQAPSGR